MKYKIFINTILIAGSLSSPITLSAMEDWNREAPEAPKKPSSSERTATLASEKKRQEEAATAEAARKATRTQPDWEAQRKITPPKPPVQEIPVKPTPVTEPAQKKPGFSFREFFGFGKKKKDEFTITIPEIKKDADVQIDQNLKPINVSLDADLKKLKLEETDRLLQQAQNRKISHQEMQWITAYSDEILKISPERLNEYPPDMQRKMLNIIKMRNMLIVTANNMILKIEEAEKAGGTAVNPAEKEQQNKEARERLSKLYFVQYSDAVKNMAEKINALAEKATAMENQLALRESIRKLKTANKPQLKKEGTNFCQNFISVFKSQDLSQQDEISKLSMPTLRQVAPNFLKEQKALIKTLTKQQKKLDPGDTAGRKNLLKRLEAARDAVSIIEKTLSEYSTKKIQELKKERVKKLKAMKEKELSTDKQKYLELKTRELALETNPTPINQRELMKIRIQKKELEDKYGQAPTQFKTLREAIRANK